MSTKDGQIAVWEIYEIATKVAFIKLLSNKILFAQKTCGYDFIPNKAL